MQKDKMQVLLHLKKSGLDKSGQAPIMGRITHNRTMVQFSSKQSCNPKLWNTRESRLNGKSREVVANNAKLEQLLLSVQRAYQTLCDRGVEFSAKEIKEQFQDTMQSELHSYNDTTKWLRTRRNLLVWRLRLTRIQRTTLLESIYKLLSKSGTTQATLPLVS